MLFHSTDITMVESGIIFTPQTTMNYVMELMDGLMKEFKDIASSISCLASIVLSTVTGMVLIISTQQMLMRLEPQLVEPEENMDMDLKA